MITKKICDFWTDQLPIGWREITEEMFDRILEIVNNDPDTYADWCIMDCKEKYGSGRLYLNYINDEIDTIIHDWEERTGDTCVNCGKPATHDTEGYILPFCDGCDNG